MNKDKVLELCENIEDQLFQLVGQGVHTKAIRDIIDAIRAEVEKSDDLDMVGQVNNKPKG